MSHKKHTFILCGIVRDAEKGLKKNIPIINAFLSGASSFKILIFENDSKDKTKQILKDWEGGFKEGEFCLITDNRDAGETIPLRAETGTYNPYFSAKRISKMVDLRNQYLDYIAEHNWYADYVIVMDLDVASINLKGLISVFSVDKEWDAISSNGYSYSPSLRRRYHDSYALTLLKDSDNPQNMKTISENSLIFGKLKEKDEWIKVYSAYGGLSIYKFEAIRSLRYKLIYNNDSDVEVKCEHFSICKQMIDRGYDKIFIVPSLKLKYQTIDYQLISGKLKQYIQSIMIRKK